MDTIDKRYLESTAFFDYTNTTVREFADSLIAPEEKDPIAIAIALYDGTRDSIRYNPYAFSSSTQSLSASYALATKSSYCIPKAVLLGAMARYRGIPSRLGLANVRNHLSSPEFIEFLDSDIFVMHGYIELHLEGQWVKATPAFNKELCELMDVQPLEFNGREDSVFHEFTGNGAKHMEYLVDHGQFADVPVDFILKSINEAYPHIKEKMQQLNAEKADRSFEQDLSHE